MTDMVLSLRFKADGTAEVVGAARNVQSALGGVNQAAGQTGAASRSASQGMAAVAADTDRAAKSTAKLTSESNAAARAMTTAAASTDRAAKSTAKLTTDSAAASQAITTTAAGANLAGTAAAKLAIDSVAAGQAMTVTAASASRAGIATAKLATDSVTASQAMAATAASANLAGVAAVRLAGQSRAAAQSLISTAASAERTSVSVARLAAESRAAGTSMIAASSMTDRATAAAGRLTAESRAASVSLGWLRGSLAAVGVVLVAERLIHYADTWKLVQSRLSLVTASTTELAVMQSRLFEMANRTRTAYEPTVDLYARMARSSKNLGLSQGELVTVTEAINKTLKISGGSAESSAAALFQLSQGLASGVVRGEEFNSVMEQAPRLAEALAAALAGGDLGKLRKMAENGELTAKRVTGAILSQAAVIDREFTRIAVTVADSWTVLSNAVTRYVGEADGATGVTRALAGGIGLLAENFGLAGDAVTVMALAVGTTYAARALGPAIAKGSAFIAQQAELSRALMTGNAMHVEGAKAVLAKAAADKEASVAASASAAANLSNLQATKAAIEPLRERAVAQRASATAQMELNKGIMEATGRSDLYAKALTARNDATRTLLNYQRLERGLTEQITVATNAKAAADARALADTANHAAALRATSVSARLAAAAMTGLKAVMSFFGGPIGLAITALAAGIAYYATRTSAAEDAQRSHTDAMRAASQVMGETSRSAAELSAQYGKMEEKAKSALKTNMEVSLAKLKADIQAQRAALQDMLSSKVGDFGLDAASRRNLAASLNTDQLREFQAAYNAMFSGGDAGAAYQKIADLAEVAKGPAKEALLAFKSAANDAFNALGEADRNTALLEAKLRLLNGAATDADRKLLNVAAAAGAIASSAPAASTALDGLQNSVLSLGSQLDGLTKKGLDGLEQTKILQKAQEAFKKDGGVGPTPQLYVEMAQKEHDLTEAIEKRTEKLNDAKNKTKSMAEQSAQWVKEADAQVAAFNRLADAQTKGSYAVAEAERINRIEQEVLKSGEAARTKITDRINAQTAAQRRLNEEAARTDASRQIEAAQRLAEAQVKGAAAVKEATIQNEIAAKVQQEQVAVGSVRAKQIEEEVRALHRYADAGDLAAKIKAQQDGNAELDKEIALLGQSEEARAVGMARIAAMNDLRKMGIDLEGELTDEVRKQADAYVKNAEDRAKKELQRDKIKEAEAERVRIAKKATDDIVEYSVGVMDGWFSGQRKGWKSFASDLIGLMRRTFAQITADAIIRPTVAKVVGGFMGVQQPGGGGGIVQSLFGNFGGGAIGSAGNAGAAIGGQGSYAGALSSYASAGSNAYSLYNGGGGMGGGMMASAELWGAQNLGTSLSMDTAGQMAAQGLGTIEVSSSGSYLVTEGGAQIPISEGAASLGSIVSSAGMGYFASSMLAKTGIGFSAAPKTYAAGGAVAAAAGTAIWGGNPIGGAIAWAAYTVAAGVMRAFGIGKKKKADEPINQGNFNFTYGGADGNQNKYDWTWSSLSNTGSTDSILDYMKNVSREAYNGLREFHKDIGVSTASTGQKVALGGLSLSNISQESLSSWLADATRKLARAGALRGDNNVVRAAANSTAAKLEDFVADLDFAKSISDAAAYLKNFKFALSDVEKQAKATATQGLPTLLDELERAEGLKIDDSWKAINAQLMRITLGTVEFKDTTTQSEKALASITGQFAGFRQVIKELGLAISEAEVRAAEAQAQQRLRTGFETSIADQILALKDPLAYQLGQQAKVAADRIREARALGGTQAEIARRIVQVEALNALEREKIIRESATTQTQIVEEAARRMAQAMERLKATQQELTYGNLTVLSATDRLSLARGQFTNLAARANNANDIEARELLPDVIKRFLESSREVNASSSAYQADYKAAMALLQRLTGSVSGYAEGGVSTGLQLAWVSEGRWRQEAHVPLPDGRSIPVSLRGPVNDNGGIIAELRAGRQQSADDNRALRAELRATHEEIAQLTRKLERHAAAMPAAANGRG